MEKKTKKFGYDANFILMIFLVFLGCFKHFERFLFINENLKKIWLKLFFLIIFSSVFLPAP